jgi:acid phosphatase type 7
LDIAFCKFLKLKMMKKTVLLTLSLALTSLFALGQEAFKITHGPYLQAMDEAGVNIIWTTNKNAISWVELAPNDSTHFYRTERRKYFAVVNGLKKEATLHNVRIGGLMPATAYRYRIYSQEVQSHESYIVKYGNVAAAAAYQAKLPTFTTNNKTADVLNFEVINDIHQRNGVMKALLNQVDWRNTDCVFFNGDMQNNSRSEEQIFTSFMDTATQIFADRIPMYYARGNHETRGEFAHNFSKYFPAESGRVYYMVRNGPVCFVVLDTGEDKPDSDIEYSGITDFDEYRTEQAAWLKEALKSADYVTARYKVVIGHIPPFGGWHGEKEIADKFIPLLNEAGAQIMIAAHLHSSVKKMPETGGAHFPVLVNSNNSILKAKATKNYLLIEMYDLQGKLMDSIKINPAK